MFTTIRPLPALVLAACLALTLTGIARADDDASGNDGLSERERAEVETLVRDYILDHPEVILEAVQRLQARQQAEEEARSQAALADRAEDIDNHPMDPTHGPADAPVTLVEFFDYNCGYCKKLLPVMTKLIEERDDLRIVFKEFPILTPESEIAARAALAADRQDLYLPFHQALMSMRGQMTEARILETAASVGLDLDRLRQDMAAGEISRHIAETKALAQEIGVTGTPALVIGDTLVPGAVPYERIVALLDEAEARATAE
ncbi:DsbA family protein [Marivibrio halodurans]|uniref:DsbA family protein n=1 Tax=Marivibrio halodurans TaxID=2039722 RepID=A0A8J7S6H7_9PROT|nr:DsbA family protein [Marivibrio halodurans]MBP5857664.1 DsbA family protein [Marivibrio halodurans]